MPDIPKGAGELMESKYVDAMKTSQQSATINPNQGVNKKKSFWSKLFGK